MEIKKQNVTAFRNSSATIDMIKQMTDSDVTIEEILSLGNVSICGVFSRKIQYDEWFMIAKLTHGLHLALNESLKPDERFNKSKFRSGLLSVYKKVDSIHQAHPETILINDLTGDDKRFSLGFIGLTRNYMFNTFSVESKNEMYKITKACHMFIAELLKPSAIRDFDKTTLALNIIAEHSYRFHRNSRGATLFLEMNQP